MFPSHSKLHYSNGVFSLITTERRQKQLSILFHFYWSKARDEMRKLLTVKANVERTSGEKRGIGKAATF